MAISDDANREITVAEAEIKKLAAAIKKLLSTLESAKTKIAEKPWPLRDMRKLALDLQNQVLPATAPLVEPLIVGLNAKIELAASEFEKTLIAEISREAQTLNVTFGLAAGVRYLGPFELALDLGRETAALLYAKQPASVVTTLDPKAIVELAKDLDIKLLSVHPNDSKLAMEFEEALKVVLIRDRKAIDGRELRAMLPEVYREMQYIRQDKGRPLSADSYREYSLARFVIELKLLVQSDSNLESAKRFRLETAVIENTKNAKKSVFVPTDPRVGYGEGTYFQALVLVEEGR